MVDDIDVLHDVIDEVDICDRALSEFVAPVGFGRLVSGVDVVLFEAGVVKRFKDVESGDIVVRVDEGFGEVAADETRTATRICIVGCRI